MRVAASLFGPASTTVTRGTTQNITFVLSAPAPAALTLILRSDNPTIASCTGERNDPRKRDECRRADHRRRSRIHGNPGQCSRHHGENVERDGGRARSITLPAATAPLGQTVPFAVRLGTPAPSGGMTLTLTSSKSTTVRVSPASVFIPGGATAPSSQPQVTGVNIGAATITASAPGYTPASQSVPVPATISFSPTSLTITQPGTSQKLLLALSHSAPWGQDGNLWGDGAGVTVQLSSSNPNVAGVPATVDLYPDGSSFTTVVVLVRGIASGTAVIRASAPPFIPEITATITVGSAGTRVPASITATGGTSQSAAVNNTFAAPLAVTVRDAGGNPVSGVVVMFTPPASGPGGSFAGGVNTALTNAAGVATSAAFTANSTAGTYSVLASVSGVSARAVFQMANTASSSGAISLPVNVSVGTNQSVTFPVSLTKSAPQGGVNVTLSSSDPSRVNITPATVFIAAGATTAAVQPRVGGVNFGSANITASAPGYSAATESVRVAAALAFAPSSVTIQGANTENLTLTLSAPAPAGGLIVTLKSDRTTVATVPSAVTFGADATSVTCCP